MEQILEHEELVTTHYCDTIYRRWSVSMTKQELIDYGFDVESFVSDNPDRIDMGFESCEEVEEVEQDGPFYEWREKWEESEEEV